MPSVEGHTSGRAYWRSLDHLADTPEFRAKVEGEFADYLPQEMLSAPSRRRFLKLMGASMGLAGVAGASGCRRWPEKKLAPYNERPEGHMPGVPEHYATVMELGGVARPLLAASYDGRPIKLEGNPSHPQSGGASDMFAQASILDMYDPDRSRFILQHHHGEKGAAKAKGEAGDHGPRRTWAQFAAALEELNLRANGGAGFAILSEATSSPSMAALRKQLAQTMPQARWYEYESLNRDNEVAGAKLAFGAPLRAQLHLDKADVIACLDADILCGHPAALRHARDWAKGRRSADQGRMNRLYAAEPHFSVTGTNADVRLAAGQKNIILLVRLLRDMINPATAGASSGAIGRVGEFAEALAKDLKAHRGRSILVAGESLPPQLHAAVHEINQWLGNHGSTITFIAEPSGDQPGHVAQIRSLTADMKAGKVKTLLILGGNPAYDAPADLDFAHLLHGVETSIHLSSHVNETSAACTWHVPRSHYLESWGDARSWDGTLSIQQPLIQPLFADSRSAIELVAHVVGDELSNGYDIVRRTFKQYLPVDRFERTWRRALHDGLVAGSASPAVTAQLKQGVGTAIGELTLNPPGAPYEIAFIASNTIYDGRFANNGWLQETPDPVTKLTWDNAALVAKHTADELGLHHGQMLRLTVEGHSFDVPVYIAPGQAHETISVALGYGRTKTGYVGENVGFDVAQARSSGAMHFAALGKDEIKNLRRSHKLVTTQDHHLIDAIGMKERAYRVEHELIRRTTLEHYQADPDFAQKSHLTPELRMNGGKSVPLQIFDAPVDYDDPQIAYKWAMGIDLNACIGCGACLVACQAENNVPIVGKDQVARGREMHWIRVDRYFSGDPDDSNDVAAVHQPLTCHHCETAPCEQVCPVAATTHDSEGLNVMIYNRCIGTRYCSNNCPYKVRRFNWFDWHVKPIKSGAPSATHVNIPDTQQTLHFADERKEAIRKLMFNPEVTVRMRGVMEKCTFCVQRIKAATIPAKNELARGERSNVTLEDGTITPACSQACPTEAIVFGDLKDRNSRVSKMFADKRAYEVLEEINVRARTRYLARITNPAPGFGPKPTSTHKEKAAPHH